MDEPFVLFLQDIPEEYTGFVLTLDEYLTTRGSKRTVKVAKSGFVASYTSPKTGRALLNYVFRKTGVKVRVYAEHIGSHPEVLRDLPRGMKAEIQRPATAKGCPGRSAPPPARRGIPLLWMAWNTANARTQPFFIR